jgi:predicted DNA-binding protein
MIYSLLFVPTSKQFTAITMTKMAKNHLSDGTAKRRTIYVLDLINHESKRIKDYGYAQSIFFDALRHPIYHTNRAKNVKNINNIV